MYVYITNLEMRKKCYQTNTKISLSWNLCFFWLMIFVLHLLCICVVFTDITLLMCPTSLCLIGIDTEIKIYQKQNLVTNLTYLTFWFDEWTIKRICRFRRDVLEGTLEEMLEPEIVEKDDEEDSIPERWLHSLHYYGFSSLSRK